MNAIANRKRAEIAVPTMLPISRTVSYCCWSSIEAVAYTINDATTTMVEWPSEK